MEMIICVYYKQMLQQMAYFLFRDAVKRLDLSHFAKTTNSRANSCSSSGRDGPGTTGHDLLAALALPDTNSSALDSVL
jgi:hypothetical protein